MMPKKLIPIGDDVIIHPFEEDIRGSKIGSLYVPDQAKRRINQGIIISKGPLVSGDVSIGDHVMFSGYTGDTVSFIDGGTYFVVPESHLLVIVEESDVVLMDTRTVKRIIQERFGELRAMQRTVEASIGKDWFILTNEIEESLLDRIDSITVAEGFEW
jgi:co-chaperonin GroES (HSP10)